MGYLKEIRDKATVISREPYELFDIIRVLWSEEFFDCADLFGIRFYSFVANNVL